MKTIILCASVILAFVVEGFGQVNPRSTYVEGYYRSNGTYVNGYYRTTPNNTINDNYSTFPNVNPYTGQQGTIQPTYPSFSNPIYSIPNIVAPTYTLPTFDYNFYDPFK
jgi:hypothetical protein